MQKNTVALLIGSLLLTVGAVVVVPQFVAEEEIPLVRWDAADEVEVRIEAETAESDPTADGTERMAVDLAPGAMTADDARVALILRGRVVDKYNAPVPAATVWLGYSRSGRGGRGGGPGGPGGFQFGGTQRRIPDPVTTDEDGRFAFQGEAFRNLRVALQVAHDRYAPGLFDRDLGEVSAEVDLQDLVLMNGGETIGRVTDLEGNGIGAATVELAPQNSREWQWLRDRSNLLKPRTTDNNGYYRLPHTPAGEWVVNATARQHTEGRSPTFTVEEDQQAQVDDIRLGPGFEVTGYVRDGGGQPIAKARVSARATGVDPANGGNRGPGGPGGPGGRGNRGNPGFGRQHTTETDAQGRFFLEHLPGVAMRLDAQADGYLDANVDFDPQVGQPVHLTLQDGLRIAGTVVDGVDGQPVTLFTVNANRVRGLPIPGLENVDIGDLMQRMRDGNLDDATREQIRQQFETLRAQGADFGRGRGGPGNDRGRGGPGADRGNGGNGRNRGQEPERHPGGTFVVTGLQEGIYEVTVQSTDHALFTSAEIELRSGITPPSLSIRLDRGFYFAGLVVDDSGRPIREATVELRAASAVDAMGRGRGRGQSGDTGGRPDFAEIGRQVMRMANGASVRLEAKTDQEGEFVFTHVPQGSYRVRAQAEGHATSEDQDVELAGDRSDGKIELGALGSLAGTVRGLQAGDAGQARVAAVRVDTEQGGGPGFMRGRGGFERADVAADGSYTIAGLAPGSYVVRAWVGDQQDIMRQLMPAFMRGELLPDATVKGGETTRLDLTVTRPQVGIVAGTVLHNGNPGKGLRVELASLDDSGQAQDPQARGGRGGRGGFWRGQQSATVTGNGTFRIERVTAGRYTLRVQTDDRTQLHEEQVFVAADATSEYHINVRTARLRGAVTAANVEAKDLDGSVALLAGVTTVPDDMREWRRTPGNTTVNGRVRDGRFEFETLQPGSYLMVVTIRGRERSSTQVVVNDGDNEASIEAGAIAPPGTDNVPGSGNPARSNGPGGNGGPGGGNRANGGGGRRGR